MKLIAKFSRLREDFAKDLKVSSLLIGATDFEVCVIYPDFGAGQNAGLGIRNHPRQFDISNLIA